MSSKVLIVDDEDYFRLLIEQALEGLKESGVQLLTAENGDQALAIIKSEKPNLIFLDGTMPLKNGYDVCREVKQDLKLEGIYVVMLTAHSQAFDKATASDVGADVYITKPFDPDELLSKAKEVLKV